MRPVTDILMGLFDTRTGRRDQGPVAYILHPMHHEVICPWCADSLGAVAMPAGSTYLELYSRLYNRQVEHISVCRKRKATKMKVKVAK